MKRRSFLHPKSSPFAKASEDRKILNPRAGFSYVELMIVIVLIVMSSLGGVLSLIRFNRMQVPKLAAQSIRATLLDARARSTAQVGGSYWGVKLDAFTGRDRYTLFYASGADLTGFATSSSQYISSLAVMTEPASSSTILFNKRTGAWISGLCPSATASTTVTVGSSSVRVYCDGRVE